jgi:tryptophan 2,3-dioxygenase
MVASDNFAEPRLEWRTSSMAKTMIEIAGSMKRWVRQVMRIVLR